MKKFLYLPALLLLHLNLSGQHSIARQWNELTLNAIRSDLARPVVHARNLFHISTAMYDAWAVFDDSAQPYILGHVIHGHNTPFEGFETQETINDSRKKAISYAAFTVLKHRFRFTPPTVMKIDSLMESLGYDPYFTREDYHNGDAAALGIYIGNAIISYGLSDNSNEFYDYRNEYYQPVNDPLDPTKPGNPDISNPNRWQPLIIDSFTDQSGNVVPGGAGEFLGPEWGNVYPFALTEEHQTKYLREDNEYIVYLDTKRPPQLNLTSTENQTNDLYKWNFELVSIWSSHHDPYDGVMIDISPKTRGNISRNKFPTTPDGYKEFYHLFTGSSVSKGHEKNPYTGLPYEEQIVPLGDYTRVLAEFWADGPSSETPPGHWFTILNYVSDQPELTKNLFGNDKVVSNLEWDIKSYFTLGAGMHDAAVAAWSIKGWYDYIRPISAIRYLSDLGQCSDPTQISYNEHGIRLYKDFIELVLEDDSLAKVDANNIGKIKVKAWRGPDFIDNPEIDHAGVGWILAENWWPYQRPNFVTPPFAGYVSGHSTFSRAAAEILTLITDSEYFPGGLGEFVAKKNEFLVFEEGPSQDIILQWATYRDASDETSLSRIWGGIHPPADDIPGRIIGEKIADLVVNKSKNYFDGTVVLRSEEIRLKERSLTVYPNPALSGQSIHLDFTNKYNEPLQFQLINTAGKVVMDTKMERGNSIKLNPNLEGLYTIVVKTKGQFKKSTKIIIRNN